MKSSVIECKISNQTSKLPGAVCSTRESWAVGYTYIKHCTTTIMDQENGHNQWKSHEFLSLWWHDRQHKRAGFEACTLHHQILCMVIFQITELINIRFAGWISGRIVKVYGVWTFWLRLHSCFGSIQSDSGPIPKYFQVLDTDSCLNSKVNAIIRVFKAF